MRTKDLTVFIMCMCQSFCFAQKKSENPHRQYEENYKWEMNFAGGLNTNGWEFMGGVHWLPVSYVGIGASVGFDSEIKEWSDWGRREGDSFYEDDYCARFIFKPSLLLRTPSLWHLKSQDLDFHLFALPGVILSPPARGARDSGWLYWSGAVGVTAIIDRLVFSLGYNCSNYYLLDGNPHAHHAYEKFEKGEKQRTHSVFIMLGYKF